MEHIPFTKSDDPRGILEEMGKMGYIHGEENVVYYYVCHIDDGKIR
jgi:hypothetical protein